MCRMSSRMQMPEEKKRTLKKCYLCVELILFACVLLTQAADLRSAEDVLIWLCIGFNAVYMSAVSGSGLACLIMLLTWFADTLLVLLDVCYTGGVLLFCCVQLLYAWYLHRRGYGLVLIRSFLFAMLLAVYLTGLTGEIVSGEAFYVLPALFSFSQLSVNVLGAVLMAGFRQSFQLPHDTGRRTCEDRLFAAGLILFLGCDVCVGLRNLPVPSAVQSAAYSLNWIFYIPSQILLTLGLQSACVRIAETAKNNRQ